MVWGWIWGQNLDGLKISVAPPGLGGVGIVYPVLTHWANFCRASGAGLVRGVCVSSYITVDGIAAGRVGQRRE